MALAAILVAGACGKKGDSGPVGGSGATPAPAGAVDAGRALPPIAAGATHAVDASGDLPIVSGDVDLVVGTRHVGATLVKPSTAGTWPGLLLMAGSGPTDRNWNNPLIETTNGSGRLIAEALARRGMVVLRWDKAGSGKNPGPPLDQFSLDTYRDEGAAALAYLRGRADVRADAIFVAGHSEGGIHATRLAGLPASGIRGVIFLSAAGRRLSDIMVEQLEGNFRDGAHFKPDAVAAQMKPIKQALDDFLAGKPVDPATVSPFPGVQQLVKAIVLPATATLSRALLAFDPAAEAAKLPQHDFFVGGGGKDIQVDPEKDGKRLVAALEQAGKQVTFHVAPDADHVLKHEPRTVAEIRADLTGTQAAYNAEGRVLDDDFVGAVAAWLAAETRTAGAAAGSGM